MRTSLAYAQLKGTSLYYMSKTYTVKEEGYAYLYVSNEQPVQTDVYFDDVTMTYTPTPGGSFATFLYIAVSIKKHSTKIENRVAWK